MGTYVRGKLRGKRSLADTLNEAEEEHFLDCPNADFLLRAAAYLLDLIFLFLLFSAIKHLFTVIVASPFLGQPEQLSEDVKVLLALSRIGSETLVIYFYFIWTLTVYGGSPAKLIFGLRVVHAETGEKLSFFQAIIREVFGKTFCNSATLGIGFLLPLFRDDARALHDLLSRSLVKKIHGHP